MRLVLPSLMATAVGLCVAGVRQAHGQSDHWAYQKLEETPVPVIGESGLKGWPVSEVDSFVIQTLREKGLTPNPDAEPEVLLRRVHFDLHGLPPSIDERKRFLATSEGDGVEVALASEVDRLLNSPRFGERWGRHWLDVARYAESSGKESDFTYPHAWRYRDYVIDSFNADLPFDQFLREQIAGDLLEAETDEERARLLVATGFLAIGPRTLNEMNPLIRVADGIDEQIDAVGRAFLGSSIACARCHDHFQDPFTMEDYYSLAGIFLSTDTYFGTMITSGNVTGGQLITLPLLDGQVIPNPSIPKARYQKFVDDRARFIRENDEAIAAAKAAREKGEDARMLYTVQMAVAHSWRIGGIDGKLRTVFEGGAARPLAMGVLDAKEIKDAPLLARGDVSMAKDLQGRRFPEVFQVDTRRPTQKESGRRELADWMTHPDHPLTARVYVNRVWNYLFGAGLVRTPDNFGVSGKDPTHRALLDHLALKFQREGWSTKELIRELILSRTYRQSSEHDSEKFRIDPDNLNWSRASKKRLEGEAIRDGMLCVSGDLEKTRPEGSLVASLGDMDVGLFGVKKETKGDLGDRTCRSVYLPMTRSRLPEMLNLFDAAEPSTVTGAREVTNVPPQALYLLNSPFVLARAEALAALLAKESESPKARITSAYLRCFGRSPSEEERKAGGAYLKSDGLAAFCHALLCSAEFRNLD